MKKQKLMPSLLMMGLMMTVSPSPFSVSASSGYGGGSGTQSDPYLISTPEHLNQLQLDVNVNKVNTSGKYYRLTKNIDLSEYDNDSDESNGNFTPIGSSSSIAFKGTFDGNGKVISNLEIILTEQDYVGLFGYQYSGMIQGVGLESVVVEGKEYVGGLVGYKTGSSSKISESYATGDIKGSKNVGGLNGYQSNGTISGSYATGDIKGSQNVGGLVGQHSGGTINQSYAIGSVNGGSKIGGLVGSQYNGTITQSYATGEVSGSSRYAGGLVGYQSNGTIIESYATGSVSGGSEIGGLVGSQYDGAINQSNATGDVTGSGHYVGGLVGYQGGGTISGSYATGEVSGTEDVGGLVGNQNSSASWIEGSYATGSVSGNSVVGGLVGYQGGGTISQSYAIGSVSGKYRIGGLVGTSTSKIEKSYATGSVSGGREIGGLVGGQSNGTISGSYATGEVSGSSSNVGGLVGYQRSGSISESYWNVETTGQSISQGGTGLTTKQMTKRKAKENMIGFDFDTIWQESNGYPLLHWQTPDPISGGEEDLTINGTIEATVLSLMIPSNSINFALNPNEEVGKQFIASDFELINGSQAPLTIKLKSFEQVTDVLNDVESTKYNDWTGLNKNQSKDIALALVPKVGDGWLTLNEGNRWVANLGETSIGTIKGKSTVSFGFEAKHGSSFTETLMPQYRLTFVFGLQD